MKAYEIVAMTRGELMRKINEQLKANKGAPTAVYYDPRNHYYIAIYVEGSD